MLWPIVIFVVFAGSSVALSLWFLRGQAAAVSDPQELMALARPVDLDAFRNLLDPMQERFLERSVGTEAFHALQRQRARVILSYVEAQAHNAALLVKLGESARRSPDAEQRAAGIKLANAALDMRLLSLLGVLKLRVAMVIPAQSFGMASLAETYAQLTETLALLCRLQAPTSVSRVLASV